MRRGIFKVISIKDVPPYGNVLLGRFFLTMKTVLDGRSKVKAHFVISGHFDRFKDLIVHLSQTIHPQSIGLLLVLAEGFCSDIWAEDVRQGNLQSSVPLGRDIYMDNNAPDFSVPFGNCQKLERPLYSLPESGYLWYRTLERNYLYDFKITPLRTDPSLYLHVSHGKIIGLSGAFVDDVLRAGD